MRGIFLGFSHRELCPINKVSIIPWSNIIVACKVFEYPAFSSGIFWHEIGYGSIAVIRHAIFAKVTICLPNDLAPSFGTEVSVLILHAAENKVVDLGSCGNIAISIEGFYYPHGSSIGIWVCIGYILHGVGAAPVLVACCRTGCNR